MSADFSSDATAGGSDPRPVDALLPVVYRELRALAHRQLRRDAGARTLQATALVHEAYLRLDDAPPVAAVGRAPVSNPGARRVTLRLPSVTPPAAQLR